jgi:hypothetical protein
MAVLLALVPWHPALWWQAARLHRAIELDCDARVVRRVRDRTGYGRMLIEAATRHVPAVPLAAALGARSPLLEHRIRSLVAAPRRGSPVVAAAAVVLFAMACALPTPFEPERGHAVSTFRPATRSDSLPEVTVGTVRAIGTPSRDAAAAQEGTGGTYEMREVPAGVLRRADPDDPRLPARPRR